MRALYRKRLVLPSVVLAMTVAACEDPPPAGDPQPQDLADAELELMQQAEALRHSIEEHELEQGRLERLLDADQLPAR